MTPEEVRKYRAWRDAVKYTDEEIAGALERRAAVDTDRRGEFRELARRCRRGYVGKRAVREAWRYLVTSCTVCGEKALYAFGHEGRCSAHRRQVPAWHWTQQDDHGVDAEVAQDARARERAALGLARWRAGKRRRA
jgi:hypothetical protein